MDLATLAQLGEFVGGIGVVLSLIYLGIQVRGNTKSQQADITARVVDRMAGMQTVFGTDSEANALFNQGVSDPTKMTMQDRTRFMWLLTEFFGAMEFLMQQYHADNIDRETWDRWAATFDWWLTWPGIRAYWVGRAIPFTKTFTSYVDLRIASGEGQHNEERFQAFMLTGNPNPPQTSPGSPVG
jgi:hypothetical protein